MSPNKVLTSLYISRLIIRTQLPSFCSIQEVYFNLLYAFRILVYVNSAINPVLYNVTSSKFRGAFFRWVRCATEASRQSPVPAAACLSLTSLDTAVVFSINFASCSLLILVIEVIVNLLTQTSTKYVVSMLCWSVRQSRSIFRPSRLLGLRRGGPLHHTGTTTTTAHNTTVTGGGSTHNSLVKSSWRGQKLVVRCSYTCMWREGERRPLVDRQPHSPHTWGHTNPAGHSPSPATSPFLTRACPRPANRHLESFV